MGVKDLLNREVQTRAQNEIRSSLGDDHLPSLEEYVSFVAFSYCVRPSCVNSQSSFPYLDAVIREVYRWEAISPLAITPSVSRDDTYRGTLSRSRRTTRISLIRSTGLFIPKGTTVKGPQWFRTSSESLPTLEYLDPKVFSPERFLAWVGETKPIDPRLYSFGIGRRYP